MARKKITLPFDFLIPKSSAAPSVVTDLQDYVPGQTAHITANNFTKGATVLFTVEIIDPGLDERIGTRDDSYTRVIDPWLVTDGSASDLDGKRDGGLKTTHLIPDEYFGQTLRLTAVELQAGKDRTFGTADDVITGKKATWVFTDVGTGPVVSINKITGDGPGGTVVDGDGVTLGVGTTVIWTYTVRMLVNGSLTNVVVRDNNGTPGNTADDFNANPVLNAGFNIGDTDKDNRLDFGETWTFTATGTVQEGLYSNIGRVTAKAGLNTFSATDPSSYTGVVLEQPPQITLVKTVEGPDTDPTFEENESINEGTSPTVTYQYVLTNTSPNAATDPLTVNTLVDDNGTPGNAGDDFTLVAGGVLQPNVTLVKTGGNQDDLLEQGETWTFTVDRTVAPGDASSAIVNTARVTATDNEGNSASDDDTATVTAANVDPAITIVKTVDGPDLNTLFEENESVAEGSAPTFTYKYELTNTSAQAAVDPLTITGLLDDNGTPGDDSDDVDVLADGTFEGGDANGNNLLDAGETWTYTIQRQVAPGNAGDAVINTAVVTATDDEGTTATDDDTATVTANSVDPAITLVKTVEGPDADATFEENESINEGQSPTVTYKYVLTNTSTQAAVDPLTIVSLIDDNGTPGDDTDDINVLVDGTFLGSDANGNDLLDAGETWTFTVERAVGPLDAGGTIVNTAKVTATDDEGTSASDDDEATVTAENVDPAITIVKTVDADGDTTFSDSEAVNEGTSPTVTYKYVLTNTSTQGAVDPLTIVSLIDDNGTPGDDTDDINVLVDGTFLGSDANGNDLLDAGETWTFTVQRQVAPGDAGGSVVNTADVTATDDEGTTATDDDTATVTAAGVAPTISVLKEVDANDDATFTDESETVSEGTLTAFFKYTITAAAGNAATDKVTITSINDDRFGDLLADAVAANGGNPIVLDPGESFDFTIARNLELDDDETNQDPHVNVVTVVGEDDEGTDTNSATDDATILVNDATPAISVLKEVDADGDTTFSDESEAVSEGTFTASFKYTITAAALNASTDPVTITSINDDRFGDLLADAVAGNGGNPIVLDAGESFDFTITRQLTLDEGENLQDPHVNVVTVVGEDDEGTDTNSATDDATILVNDATPAISVLKEVNADGDTTFSDESETVTEGSFTAFFKYTITAAAGNASTDKVTITTINDDRFGDLLIDAEAQNGGNPIVLDAGESFSFTISRQLELDEAETNQDPHVNIVTVTGEDDEGTDTNSATDDATILVNDATPKITIDKIVSVDGGEAAETVTVNEGAHTVTYHFRIAADAGNASTDPVTITSLEDDTLDVDGDQALFAAALTAFQTIPGNELATAIVLNPGQELFFLFTPDADDQPVLDANAADDANHINTVTVVGEDDEGTTATDDDKATIEIKDVLPTISVVKEVDANGDAVFNDESEELNQFSLEIVTYKVTITNTSTVEAVTLTSIADNQIDDDAALLAAAIAANGGSAVLGIGQSVTFTYESDDLISVDVGEEFVNTVTVIATDDEGNEANDDDDAAVIGDAVPLTEPLSVVTDDDDTGDDVPPTTNGNPGGPNDDAPALTSGFLPVNFQGDTPGTVVLTDFAFVPPPGFSHVLSPDSLTLTISQGSTEVLRFEITDTVTGAYTVTQLNPIEHATGDTENNISFSFGYVATDSEGDISATSITISVDDDTPENNAATATRTVHEDALPTGNKTGEGTKTVTETFTAAQLALLVAIGADAPGAISLNQNIETVNGGATGVDSKDFAVTFDSVSATQTNGVAAGDGNRVVFTIVQTAGNDGDLGTSDDVFTFTLVDQVDHEPNNAPSSDSDLLNLSLANVFVATDNDGDSIVVDAGASVSIENDVPVNYTPETKSTTNVAGGVITGDLNTGGTALGNTGADDTGTMRITSYTQNAVTVTTNGSDSGLKSVGATIFLHGFGTGVITGTTDTNAGDGLDPALTVFTMTLDPANDRYVFNQLKPIDNGAGVSLDGLDGQASGNPTFDLIVADDPATVGTTEGVLFSAYELDAAGTTVTRGTVNVSTQGAGVSNQSMNDGEVIGIDFANNVTLGSAGSDDFYNYSAHYLVNGFSFTITQVTPSADIGLDKQEIRLRAYDSADDDPAGTSEATHHTALTPRLDVTAPLDVQIQITRIQKNGVDLDLGTLTSDGNGGFLVTGLDKDDVITVFTAGGFDRIEIENPLVEGTSTLNGDNFDIGKFGFIRENAGNNISMSFGTTLTDFDGDSASGTIGLTLQASGAANTVNGGPGNDTILGVAANDTLNGNAGDDILVGGAGNDVMNGGAGTDTFRYLLVSDGADTINSFDKDAPNTADEGDILDIKDIIDYVDGTPSLAEAISGGFVQLVSANAGADTVVQVDQNGATGGATFSTIATLVGVAHGTAAADLADNFLLT